MRHGLTEVTRVSPHIGQRLLDLAGRTWNGVGHLIPVLGLQLPSAVDLDEGQAQTLVRVGRATRHSVDVAESLRKTVKVVHAVGRKLARDALDIRQVIDRPVGVLLSGGPKLLDLGVIDAREPQRVRELVRCVGRSDGLGREPADADGRAQERERAERRGHESPERGDSRADTDERGVHLAGLALDVIGLAHPFLHRRLEALPPGGGLRNPLFQGLGRHASAVGRDLLLLQRVRVISRGLVGLPVRCRRRLARRGQRRLRTSDSRRVSRRAGPRGCERALGPLHCSRSCLLLSAGFRER